MDSCRSSCTYLAIIVAILAGVALGVLFALGLITTPIFFWGYLATGVLGVLLSPIYAAIAPYECDENCYCRQRTPIIIAALGTIITAAVGLIVAAIASTIVLSIIIGISTFFLATLLILIICLVRCLCRYQTV